MRIEAYFHYLRWSQKSVLEAQVKVISSDSASKQCPTSICDVFLLSCSNSCSSSSFVYLNMHNEQVILITWVELQPLLSWANACKHGVRRGHQSPWTWPLCRGPHKVSRTNVLCMGTSFLMPMAVNYSSHVQQMFMISIKQVLQEGVISWHFLP